MDRAQWIGLLLMPPLAVFLIAPYVALWSFSALGTAWKMLLAHPFLALVLFIVGVVIHELLHGLSWWYFGRKPRSVIKYGFQVKTLTPYAHCTEPMDVRAYRIGAAMPGLVLGIAPWLVGLATGHEPSLLFGLLFTIAALGDAMVLWMIRHVERGRLVIDHPTQAGCYVIEPDDEGRNNPGT